MDRPTVLVIDDSPSNIEVLKNILIDKYRVKVAISGPAGIKIAFKDPPPDMILVDIIMPEMDGYEVCREIKANPAASRIPVLFVTGTANEDEVMKGLALGAEGFIMKPLDGDIVLELVAKHLKG